MVIRGTSLLIVASLMLTLGCTGKPSKRTVHDGPRSETNDGTGVVDAAEAGNMVVAAFKARFETSKKINSGTSEQNLAIALELEKIVLNSTVLSDPDLAGRSEFDLVLSMFHRALDKAMDGKMDAVVASGVLDRYEKAALAYCTEGNSNCIRLALFRGDHLASRILMRIAGSLEPQLIAARLKREATIKRIADSGQRKDGDLQTLQAENTVYFGVVYRYYRLLQLSYEMNNGQTSPELDQKYVNFARDYFEYFRKLPADQKQHEFHKRHRDTLTLALGHLKNQARGGKLNPKYCKFLTDLNPLDTEMFASMDLDKRSQRSMLSEFIECSSQQGNLTQLIADFVREKNAQAVSSYLADKGSQEPRLKVKEEGYAYAIEALKEVPFMTGNLNVQLSTRTDLAFFILDRVYYRQIDLNVALSYWSRVTGLNELEFLKFARNYARLQSAYVLKVTLQNYGKIMLEHFKTKGGLSSDYFHEVVTEVNSTSQFDWDELRDRLLFMREFMIKVYDTRMTRSSAPKEAQKEYLALKDELGNLSDHISMAVTTPMTVPLYYYMAKAQGTIKIHIPWVRSSTDQWFDIPASDALSVFLRPDYGRTIPFFKFGNVDSNFDVLGKMHVLDYALRTGIFEFIDFAMLEEDKSSGLSSEVLFFKQTTKDLLTNFERSFRSELEKLDAATRNRNFSEAFMGACEDPMNLPVTFELKDLNMATYLNDRAMTESTSSIYNASSFIFAWRMNRDNVERLIKVMERHLQGPQNDRRLTPAKFASHQQIVKQVRDEIERFSKMERQLFDKMLKLDQMVVNKQRDCLTRLVKTEFVRRNELMLANIEYYKDVHAAMTVLNLIKDAPEKTLQAATAALGANAMTLNQDVSARAGRLLNVVQVSGALATMDLPAALNEALRIHNISKAPFDKLGYFVTGISTLEEGGKRIKSLNSFDHERFYQGKWDSLVRVRHQLQTLTVNALKVNRELGTAYRGIMPIANNTRVPLGTFGELELTPDYTANVQKNVNYNADQYKFIRAAMIQFSGAEPNGTQYVSWYSSGGLRVDLVEKRLSWLKDIQELGVIETSDQDTTACPKDIWGRTQAVKDLQGRWIPGAERRETCKAVRISSADVMDSYLTVMDLLRVNELERELLDMMDRPGKLEDRIKRYLYYNNEPSTTKWTYFDQFYRTNYTTYTAVSQDGASWKAVQIEDIRGRREFGWYKDTFLRNFNDAPALFPLRDAPTQIYRDGIRETIFNHLDDIMTFEEAVYNLEERKVQLGDYLIEKTTTPRTDEPHVFNNWRVMQVKERTTGPRAGTPIYLSEENSAKSWFSGFVETFAIKDTDCLVLPQPGDPDGPRMSAQEWEGVLKSKSCRQRFNEWKAGREALRMQVRGEFQEASGGAR